MNETLKTVAGGVGKATRVTAVASLWILVGGMVVFLILLWFVYSQGGKAQLADTLVGSYQHQQKLAEGDARDTSEVISNLHKCDVYCQWMQHTSD